MLWAAQAARDNFSYLNVITFYIVMIYYFLSRTASTFGSLPGSGYPPSAGSRFRHSQRKIYIIVPFFILSKLSINSIMVHRIGYFNQFFAIGTVVAIEWVKENRRRGRRDFHQTRAMIRPRRRNGDEKQGMGKDGVGCRIVRARAPGGARRRRPA